MNGGSLPPHVIPFCFAAAALGACLPLASFFLRRYADGVPEPRSDAPTSQAKHAARLRRLATVVRLALPSGIGFAVGMYVSPKWTLPRVLGSIIEQAWLRRSPLSHRSLMVVVASGLVLGEGTASIAVAVVQALRR